MKSFGIVTKFNLASQPWDLSTQFLSNLSLKFICVRVDSRWPS
jgi:hypothetical protein